MGPHLETNYTFLVLDEEKRIIKFEPQTSQPPGLYEEAWIVFAIDVDRENYQIRVAISAEIHAC